MLKILNELLEGAEINLARYIADGTDPKAIEVGQAMVDDLRADIAAEAAALEGAA